MAASTEYEVDDDDMNEISQNDDMYLKPEHAYLNDTYMPQYAQPQYNDYQNEMSLVGEAVGREYIPIRQHQHGYQPPAYQNKPIKPMVAPNARCPFLIRVRTGEKYPINTPIVKIGKKAELVDFCITNNNAVSRVHASIFVRGGRYFIMDNSSTNFTCIFNNKIPSQTEVEIVPGTNIRIADELFEFRYL